MKSYLFGLFTLLLSVFPVFSQNQDITVEQANASYFNIPRETLYLHVNKSTYITGEEIWFKGYAYDQKNNLPSLNTTNFEVEIFDEQGNEVYDGVFMGNNGSFRGNILVDSNWNSGTYYIRASTHWMHNFIEDETYTKKIRIIKDELPAQTPKKIESYDFQLLPESGHVVYNTFNTIGFKLINDQGYGVGFDQGVVQDELGNEVTTFSSNTLGLGKFNITPVPGKQYRAFIRLKDGHEVEAAFPEIHDKGVSLSINNLLENEVVMQFNTNEATIKELVFSNYMVLIRKNHLSKKMKIYFKPKELEKTISIPRSDLYTGVNTITLFKENTPVLERLIFNPVDAKEDKITIVRNTSSSDSVSIAVQAPNTYAAYDLSVSVLPSETKAYEHQDNIRSAMLLQPYLKGYIENAKHYFTNIDRDKIYDLDVLLISQGWSKYTWENIFKHTPEVRYNFNQGFKITGKIQNKKKIKVDKVYFYPSINNGAKLVQVNQDNTFEVAHFFPQKGEKLKISGIMAKGSFKKSGAYLQVQSERINRPFVNISPISERQSEQRIQNKVVVPYNFTYNIQELEAVQLKGSSQKELKKTSRISIPKYFHLNSTKITLEKAEQYFSILDYIRSTGKFRVFNQSPTDISILPIGGAVVSSIGSTSGSGQLALPDPEEEDQPKPVAVYLDDVLLSDYGILWDYRTQDVDRIYMDRTNYGAGSRGGRGGSIRIYTRRFPLLRTRTPNQDYLEYEFKKGFEPVKEFYNPGYITYTDPFFVNYGTISWHPKLAFDENGLAIFKIPNTGLDEITLHIEGMLGDGTLISKTQIVNKAKGN
ncbi:hypothetical protein [Aquimarina spongiae]|uniref:MG2 domain-containing protein n=1 Tax=Aquimarina spongiae TaxID=570521 RepID=A0A1M6FB79_9FLAO|nr:hypothetical protein [Aquimarina spongiae]SHI94960.1 hypothetical protein SAMN04488508_104188 [Aquimarina spongiae]